MQAKPHGEHESVWCTHTLATAHALEISLWWWGGEGGGGRHGAGSEQWGARVQLVHTLVTVCDPNSSLEESSVCGEGNQMHCHHNWCCITRETLFG
jgi:hypothetical protein